VETLLTFWPPGPEARTKVIVSSESGMNIGKCYFQNSPEWCCSTIEENSGAGLGDAIEDRPWPKTIRQCPYPAQRRLRNVGSAASPTAVRITSHSEVERCQADFLFPNPLTFRIADDPPRNPQIPAAGLHSPMRHIRLRSLLRRSETWQTQSCAHPRREPRRDLESGRAVWRLRHVSAFQEAERLLPHCR
jgi:hypothetical protein